jgi:ATP-dependent helicase/DNAse subunit B
MDRTEAYIQKGVIDVKNKQDIDDVICGICGNGVSADSLYFRENHNGNNTGCIMMMHNLCMKDTRLDERLIELEEKREEEGQEAHSRMVKFMSRWSLDQQLTYFNLAMATTPRLREGVAPLIWMKKDLLGKAFLGEQD